MRRGLHIRFWVEAGLAALTAFAFLLTLIWRDWIEVVFEVDPDGGDGSLEWLVVLALLVTSATLAMLARAEWRRQAAGAS